MGTNVGNLDRGLRIIMGLGLLSLVFLLSANVRWLGLMGIVPLMTGLAGSCPLYRLMGLNTCPLQKK